MIGNIKRPNPLKPFDPSSYFDPTTNTCTEADFIKILEKGVYDSSLIGKFVTLSNTVDYDGGKWVIADVDHDSENTGQTNCYDLISVDCFHITSFGSTYYWRDSSIRTWLNGTFYNGFSSNFKARMICPKYRSIDAWIDAWYNDDKIIIPSFKEIISDSQPYVYTEGSVYPIFTDETSRKKYRSDSGSAGTWWTRSLYKELSINYDWYVMGNGSLTAMDCSGTSCIAPILRVQ